eukprot:CAMPEP_0202441050 /NCGR_PEP_ID=MMETSP1360-20130828/331_1 /ASSEMBLY_ACC=CAM_ASM_000848 /TAXON_ID=515479 /ORGANISM="Licmophora paradoxa, Strain CCMP2313" /LENGTH=170 /DNA_ID=CAMNT_0049055771 /DNA_START=1184 /DNA_END=1694 /DNA_ORIENTATION=-
MKWDYHNRTCDISIPGYIKRALQRFQHPIPTKKEFSPHKHEIPQYGAKVQYPDDEDTSPALDATDTKRVQGVLGTLLFYGRAIDSTILPAIGTIATQQSNPTRNTMQAITKLLNYFLYPKHNREQQLFYMSDKPTDPNKAPASNSPPPTHNGPIRISCHIMKEVMSSAAE